MRKENIFDMIDRKIVQHFIDGSTIGIIQSDLSTRASNFIKVFESTNTQKKLLELLQNLNFDDDVTPSKLKYQIFYIKHCLSRIEDLTWMVNNKHKFENFSNLKLFKLIQLKNKLSKENALPF